MGSWVARGVVQYPKNFKRQSLTGKVLPDFREKASEEPTQKKALVVHAFLLYNHKTGHWCLSLPFKGQGLAA